MQRRKFLGLLLLMPSVLRADDDDARRARRALLQGRALPLKRILQIVHKQVPGEVVKVELETHHHRLIYEIKVLGPDGSLRKVKINARSGGIVEVEYDDD